MVTREVFKRSAELTNGNVKIVKYETALGSVTSSGTMRHWRVLTVWHCWPGTRSHLVSSTVSQLSAGTSWHRRTGTASHRRVKPRYPWLVSSQQSCQRTFAKDTFKQAIKQGK